MKRIATMVDVMSPEEVQLVHDTSLKILSEIGLSVPNKEVLDMCRAVGGEVDYDKEIVKIPVKVMEDLIAKIQKTSFCDYSKIERNRMTPSLSTQVFFYDYETKSHRYGLMEDLFKGIKLVEKLDNFVCSGAIVVPSDVPDNFSDVAGFHTVYSYAKKEGGTFILSPTSAKYIVEMSRVMGRGCGYFLETVSPLQYRKESLEMALVMIKMGCGVSVGPMVIGGAIGPVTIAGNVTLENAEILGSMFVGYALTGQTGYGYGSFNHAMDLRTMECSFGSPSQALLGMAAGQMGRYYNLWAVSNNGLTDSLLPDYQCGMEKATSSIFAMLAGCGSMGGQGIVGNDQGISLEQLVLDNEYVGIYNHIMSGFEVNEDTIGYETLKDVGIGGGFVAEEHTVEYMNESYRMSKFMNRSAFAAWEKEGKKSAYDKAHEFVVEAIKGYDKMEPVIAPSVFEELNRIRDAAWVELARERGE